MKQAHPAILSLRSLVAAAAAFAAATTGFAQQTLVSDGFNRTGSLNGSTPDITYNGANWVTKTTSGAPTTNGTVLSLPGSNQTNSLDMGTGTFASNPGVYTMTGTFTIPTGTTSAAFYGMGFVVNPVVTTSLASGSSSAGLNPAGGPNGGSPWIYISQSGHVYVLRNGATYVFSSAAGAFPSGTSHTLKLVLDTSGGAWKVDAFVNSSQLDLNGGSAGMTYSYATNPTDIRYVATTSQISSVTATLDNFSLTGPSQNTQPPPSSVTLVSESFNTNGGLHGSSPGTTINGATWSAKTGTNSPTVSGGVLSLPGSNQSAAIDLGDGRMNTHPGIYTLSMDLTIPAGSTASLFGLGFSANPTVSSPLTNTSSGTGLNPEGGPNGGAPWMYLRGNGTVTVLRNDIHSIYPGAGAFAAGTSHNLRLVIDTTQEEWVVSAFVNSTQLDLDFTTSNLTWTYTTNPAIRFLAITAQNVSPLVSATIDNVRLTCDLDPAMTRISDIAAAGVTPGVRPYHTLWIEGEAHASQTGGASAVDASAYGGNKWSGNSAGASATFTVNAPVSGRYLLNIAGSRIGGSASSPIAYSIDGSANIPITGGNSSSGTWSSGNLTWNSAAVLNFPTAGSHSLTISLTGPRTSDGTYAFTIDALSLVADPLNNLLFSQTNFGQSQIWGSTVTASTSNSGNPAANVMSGHSGVGWRPTVAPPTPSTLTMTFASARSIDVIRLVKGLNAPSGSSMPSIYTIECQENGTWVTRVQETSNLRSDVLYQLPGLVRATAVRLTVTGTSGNNIPYVNQFETYGPFWPAILSPADGTVAKSGTYKVCGFTQPNAAVALRINGSSAATVTSDSAGWFSGDVNLIAGSNVIQAQSTVAGVPSTRESNDVNYNAGGTSFIAVVDRKGLRHVADEGTNKVAVYSAGQGSSVPYTVKDEAGTTITTGSLDLSKGGALVSLPSNTSGWYDIAISGSPALTQSVAVVPSQFVLPNTSTAAINMMIDGVVEGHFPEDRPYIASILTGYAGMAQTSWVRDSMVWGSSTNPSAGVFDWSKYDERINAYGDSSQKVLGVISFFPGYLNTKNDYRYTPEDLRETYKFGQQVGTHFKGRIHAYEFQNEFDWSNTALQTVNTLMAHQRAFYLGVKSTDAGAIIATAPCAFYVDAANQLQNLRGEALDVFSFHWYPGNTGAQQVANLDLPGGNNMPSVMAIVTGLLEGRAAWNTECGYYATVSPDFTAADELIQADFYGKMAPLSMAHGLDKSFGFCYPFYPEAGKQFSMFRKTGFTPRASAVAQAVTSQNLRTAKYYGRLNTGNSNITGLVFQNTNGSFMLQIWANTAAGVSSYTLPGGITKSLATDYMGRATDTGSTSLIEVKTTAKFLQLVGSSVTSVTTLSPHPIPSTSGVAPSPIVMGWHIDKPVRSISFRDAYDVAPSSVTNSYLEVVNLSTNSFTGTIEALASNSRWTLTPGASLTVTIPANGRVTIPFTINAPTFAQDFLRIEARVNDGAGKVSSAADTLQTTGTTPVLAVIQPDGAGNLNLNPQTALQNYYSYTGQLKWRPGTEGAITYTEAGPATGVSFTDAQMFKAPALEFQAFFPGAANYFVWVKAKAGPSAQNRINIGINGTLQATAAGISGFNTSGWTWSKMRAAGSPAYVTTNNAGNRTIQIWPTNDGIKVAQVIVTTDGSFVPETTPVDYIVDNTDTGSVTIVGSWLPSTGLPGFHGSNYQHDAAGGKGSKSFRYTPNLPTAGSYEVFGRWIASSDRANNVPFDIIHSGGTTTVPVNQQQFGSTWISLGTFTFPAGTTGGVMIRNGGTTGVVVADAVKFRKL